MAYQPFPRVTEDTGSADGDAGLIVWARRTASPANTSGADADYEALQLSAGRLWVSAIIDAALPAGTNTVGGVIPKPTTAGGYTIFRSLDIDETEEEVKGTAGQVYGWYIGNIASSVRYVKFYNGTAASVIVGTTVPVLTIPVPANAAANVEFSTGIAFGTAITVAATTGVADADTGAPSANDVIINVFYT